MLLLKQHFTLQPPLRPATSPRHPHKSAPTPHAHPPSSHLGQQLGAPLGGDARFLGALAAVEAWLCVGIASGEQRERASTWVPARLLGEAQRKQGAEDKSCAQRVAGFGRDRITPNPSPLTGCRTPWRPWWRSWWCCRRRAPCRLFI